jgi:branched-chain amino acid transport system ATP-binding protein
MSEALLTLEAISAGYGQVRILRGLDIAVAAGGVTALIGGNGAGKTTIMRLIAGALPAQAGRLRFAGEDITDWPAHRRVDAGLALVPEGRLVFPSMTVEENLRLGAICHRARPATRQRREEIYELFPRLRERRDQAAGTMSGGEQQMLAIGRGLMSDPRLLLLDEPTLGLAPAIAKDVFAIVENLRRRGLTVLIAEQDVRRTLSLADNAYVVENGHVVLSGAGEALIRDERVREAYLGL